VTSRPDWIHEDIEEAFGRFIEQKWKRVLNVAAAEPVSWEAAGAKSEKTAAKKQARGPKKAWNAGSTAGAAAVEVTVGGERKKRCQFFRSLGCDKNHPVFTCEVLKKQELESKK
jgi:hypothetical protein